MDVVYVEPVLIPICPVTHDKSGTDGDLALKCSLYSITYPMMRLKEIALLRERVTKPREYPFNIPT